MSDEITQAVETPAAAPAPTPEPTQPADLGDTLAETLKEIRAREPERGEGGKFVAKAGAEDATPAVEIPGSPKAAPPDPAPPVIEAPQSLPADVKAKWNTLPPEVQTYWASREGEIHKKLTTDGERLKSLGAFEDALKPYESRLKELNAPAPELVRRLLEADRHLSTNFEGAIEDVYRMYGRQPPQSQNPGAQPDPSSALTRELHTLKSEIQQLKEAAKEATTRAGMEIINEFKKDKPYFEEALPLMNTLIETQQAKDLPAAYEMAIHASPEIRAKREAEAKKEADKKAAEEAKERAAKDAKLAPLSRRPGSTPTAKGKGSIWDTLTETHAEIKARA